MASVRRLAVLTSGGDAPGMNAAIRAVTRYAISKGIEVYAVEQGYNGLINGQIKLCGRRTVSDIIQRGGTALKTARCPEFNTYEGMKKASENLSNLGIDALVAIGGDGTFRGAQDIANNFGVKVIGLPGSIDNDLNYTDYTIGFDTACNTVLWAINSLRDTMNSHDRAHIVEVMGRKCGDIALYTGIAGGAEIIIVPETPFNIEDVCKRLNDNKLMGKTSNIIIVAEGVMSANKLMEEIKSRIDLSVRCTVLGHIQRGGAPSMFDRVLAARLGTHAVNCLIEGRFNRAVGIKNNAIIDMNIAEALDVKKDLERDLFNIADVLSR